MVDRDQFLLFPALWLLLIRSTLIGIREVAQNVACELEHLSYHVLKNDRKRERRLGLQHTRVSRNRGQMLSVIAAKHFTLVSPGSGNEEQGRILLDVVI